jgi:surface protein
MKKILLSLFLLFIYGCDASNKMTDNKYSQVKVTIHDTPRKNTTTQQIQQTQQKIYDLKVLNVSIPIDKVPLDAKIIIILNKDIDENSIKDNFYISIYGQSENLKGITKVENNKITFTPYSIFKEDIDYAIHIKQDLQAKDKSYLINYYYFKFHTKAINQPIKKTIETPKTKNIPPITPQNFRVIKKTEDSVTLSWDKAIDRDGYISLYEISYKKENNNEKYVNNAISVNNSHTIYLLDKDQPYIFRVRAKDGDGAFSDYHTIKVRTNKGKNIAPFLSKIINLVSKTTDSLTIKWGKAFDEDGQIDSYEVAYIPLDTNKYPNKKYITKYTKKTTITINNLDAGTQYVIKMRVKDNKGSFSKVLFSFFITTIEFSKKDTDTEDFTINDPSSSYYHAIYIPKNNILEFELQSDGLKAVDMVIKWKDGVFETRKLSMNDKMIINYKYDNNKPKDIYIKGSFGFDVKEGTLDDILQFGDKTYLVSIKDMFYKFKKDKWSMTDIANTHYISNMNVVFAGMSNFNADISKWDTSNVVDMNGLFSGATNFNQDISQWDTSKVENMSTMFWHDSAFSNKDLSRWDTSSIKEHLDFKEGWGSNNIEPIWNK